MSVCYERKQQPPWRHAWKRMLLVTLALFTLFALGLLHSLPRPLAGFATFALFGAILILGVFYPQSLTILANQKGLQIQLGIGIYTCFVPWDEMMEVERTRIPWWTPQGMQWIPLRGVAWTVSYGDGVRIHRKYASPILISTDDPEGLLATIRAHLPETRAGA